MIPLILACVGSLVLGFSLAFLLLDSDRRQLRLELLAVQLDRQALDLDERRRALAEQAALRGAYLESQSPERRLEAHRLLSLGWKSLGKPARERIERGPPTLVSRQRQQAEARRWGFRS